MSWGSVAGNDGLLGGRMSSITPDPAPNTVTVVGKVTGVASSSNSFPPNPRIAHACAIADGEVYCWGRSNRGALCTGLPDQEFLPAHAPIRGKAWPQQLAVADELTCARMTDGSIQCCGGDEETGRLGPDQTEVFTPFFKPITSFEGHAVAVATSDRAICALLKDGSVECWGGNASGELASGKPDDDPHPTPVKISFDSSH
jgi:alpha-tubulin suppressor-like RCC1 family protein